MDTTPTAASSRSTSTTLPWTVSGAPQRLDTGGQLVVEYDDQGALRINGARGDTVWAR
jgi:hypothetical protein